MDFKLLIKSEKFDFRNDSKLNYLIEKEFIKGLGDEDNEEQSIENRKNAYCLCFGI